MLGIIGDLPRNIDVTRITMIMRGKESSRDPKDFRNMEQSWENVQKVLSSNYFGRNPSLQLLAEDMAKEGPISESIKQKAGDFKGPEGFSNVVGVGANPVIEAMTQQLDEAKKTNELLSQIANASGARTASWLNSANAPAPSRASMLAGNK